jgi:hypothetical protein
LLQRKPSTPLERGAKTSSAARADQCFEVEVFFIAAGAFVLHALAAVVQTADMNHPTEVPCFAKRLDSHARTCCESTKHELEQIENICHFVLGREFHIPATVDVCFDTPQLEAANG